MKDMYPGLSSQKYTPIYIKHKNAKFELGLATGKKSFVIAILFRRAIAAWEWGAGKLKNVSEH